MSMNLQSVFIAQSSNSKKSQRVEGRPHHDTSGYVVKERCELR
jgi:hypothetical protein